MDVLSEIRLLHAQQPVIMITAYGSVENAVRAMQFGATQLHPEAVGQRETAGHLRAAVARLKAEEENIQLKARAQAALQLEHIVGKSEPMLKIFVWSPR